ncbi:MAG: hypothetical protein Q4F00_08135 [bacterium]|nr:hypothetical protein [bacterium]
MNICPKCQTQVQSDACFCEACGWPLDKPYPPASGESQEEIPQPGSLKERLAILSGPLRQLKAKWPKKSSNANSDSKNNSAESEYQADSCTNSNRSSKLLTLLLSIAVGVGLIAFWVWLLMRKTGERLVRLFF